MTDFPNSRAEIKQTADDLVKFLRGNIHDTGTKPDPRRAWTKQNIDLLEQFFRGLGVDCSFTSSANGHEFLWDFVGYVKYQGNLGTAESEWSTKHKDIAEDFDRLLYGVSPLKLMICRIDTEFQTVDSAQEEAERIRLCLEDNLKHNSIHYCSGEVFIIYCVWWAAEGENRDFAYILQVDGEPNYVPVREEQHFERLTN
jgi:hypothetical protein